VGIGRAEPGDTTGHFAETYVLSVADNTFLRVDQYGNRPVYNPSEWDEVNVLVLADGGSAEARNVDGYYHERMSTSITLEGGGGYRFQMLQRSEDRNELRNELVRVEGACTPVG
jgi:hypothetical protein